MCQTGGEQESDHYVSACKNNQQRYKGELYQLLLATYKHRSEKATNHTPCFNISPVKVFAMFYTSVWRS